MMNSTNIASAHILDIVFDGRNKSYGAYQLQRGYNKRMTTALSIVLSVGSLLFLYSILFSNNKSLVQVPPIPNDGLTLVDITPSPLPLRKPVRQVQRSAQVKYTVPLIVPDLKADDQSLTPVDLITNEQEIGTVTQTGVEGPVDGPPDIAPGSQSIFAVPAKINDDTLYRHVGTLPAFPGDWRRFLERFLQYPEEAEEKRIEGTVRVQFIIDKDGNISEVKALNNPGGGIGEEAVRIIKRSPVWRPAEQNGRKVKYLHVQNITFRLE